MAYVMKASDFVNRLKDIATNYKTLYVMGCFGAPMTSKNKTRYCNNHSYNQKAARQALINAASSDTFGFDCVCLIKGVLWGWIGDKSKTYGGAVYKANGVPDVSADGMIKLCSNVTTDFSKIEIGEAVWMTGHIGIYIGDGLAVECSPKWANKVQITACNCEKPGYNTRTWTKHGKLPYIEYDIKEVTITKPIPTTSQSTIWNYLYERIGNAYGVAGMMGNLRAESALDADNLQNSYEVRLGFTDETYTAAVDNGTYTQTQFATDSAGYGLAQWTSSGRKLNLYNYVKEKGTSVGDLMTQLEFIFVELNGSYKNVLKSLKAATSVREASDVVILKYERPARKDEESVQKARAAYGQSFYDMFVNDVDIPELDITAADVSKITKVLKKTSKGEDVFELQKALIALGFSVGNKGVDGSFGKDTMAAVKAFQSRYELQVTGIFDLASIETLKKLFGVKNNKLEGLDIIQRTLKKGLKGDDVSEMQKTLESLGYSVGSKGVDGSFGKDTQSALKAFQKDYGLEETGVLDAINLNVLKKAANGDENTDSEVETSTTSSKKVEAAQKFDRVVAGTYLVTASSLHIRTGAGTTKTSIGTLKKDTVVKNYGYYSVADDGKNWLYVQTDKGVVGFCSSKYLKKC